jgi:hypothetical protein
LHKPEITPPRISTTSATAPVGEISVTRGLDLLPVVVVVSNDADASRSTAEEVRELRRGKPNRTLPPALEETAIYCRKTADVQDTTRPVEIARERLRQAGGYTREYIAPLVGFFATRTAHGQDALHSLRRELCPRPHYLLRVAPTAAFNRDQSAALSALFANIRREQ